jgi:hypothetical protein
MAYYPACAGIEVTIKYNGLTTHLKGFGDAVVNIVPEGTARINIERIAEGRLSFGDTSVFRQPWTTS